MPYVTEEIYQSMKFKETASIMVSKYPTYDKTLVYKEEKQKIDNMISLIKKFRNLKADLNMGKDFKCKFNNKSDYSLIINMLRLKDNIILNDLETTSYQISENIYDMTIYYEKQITEEDVKNKEKQINLLKASIERRKKLLNNDGYLAKAPAHLIEEERNKLLKEEEELSNLI